MHSLTPHGVLKKSTFHSFRHRHESFPEVGVISALHQFEKHLEDGAIIIIDQKKLRARILPLQA
jgi:cell division protein FtsB